jgi:hypothetical protein
VRSSKHYKWLAVFLLLFVPLLFVPADAVSGAQGRSLNLDFSGIPAGEGVPLPWKIRLKEGKADASIASEKGGNILHLICRESSFSVERDVSLDIADSPHLSWTWKVVRAPVFGDVRKRRYNDQALQLLVAFENRKVISYVWDSNAPAGTITDESLGWPLNLKIKVIVVKSGSEDMGKWITHERNIYEDYVSLFQEEPPMLRGVRIQTNTQHTMDIAEGYMRLISFSRSSPSQSFGQVR